MVEAPRGHHMAVSAVGVELRGGGPADRHSRPAVSALSASAGGLGRVLALAPRAAPGEQRIWIRRGQCRVCRRSHALVPDLVRRLDAVAVIGRGLALKVVQGLGLRTISEQLGIESEQYWWR